jgi:hypothetical protein
MVKTIPPGRMVWRVKTTPTGRMGNESDSLVVEIVSKIGFQFAGEMEAHKSDRFGFEFSG